MKDFIKVAVLGIAACIMACCSGLYFWDVLMHFAYTYELGLVKSVIGVVFLIGAWVACLMIRSVAELVVVPCVIGFVGLVLIYLPDKMDYMSSSGLMLLGLLEAIAVTIWFIRKWCGIYSENPK